MHYDERFEDDGPRRVSQAILQGPEDFGDTLFSCMGCNEDMFDVFCFRRSELFAFSQ